jgi:hypothetical protein
MIRITLKAKLMILLIIIIINKYNNSNDTNRKNREFKSDLNIVDDIY